MEDFIREIIKYEGMSFCRIPCSICPIREEIVKGLEEGKVFTCSSAKAFSAAKTIARRNGYAIKSLEKEDLAGVCVSLFDN